MPKGKTARWALTAERDADDIWDYYALNVSQDAASEIIERVETAADRVAVHPYRGRSRDDILPGLRSVLMHPYVIFYRVGEGGVEIVRVLHERRDLPALLRNEDGEPD